MRQLKLSLLIGSTTLLMIGFQNCAKYQYSGIDTQAVADGNNNGLNTDNLPDDSVSPIDQVSGSTPTAPIGSNDGMPPVTDPTAPPQPPIVSEPPVSNPPIGSEPPMPPPPIVSEPPVTNPPISSEPPMPPPPIVSEPPVTNPPIVSEPPGNSSPPGHDKPPVVSQPPESNPPIKEDDEDLEKYCNKKYAKGSSGNIGELDGEELSGLHGKLIITPENVDDIKTISDFHGKLILCGVSLERISNSSGNLTLVDSTVEEISRHNGGIHIIGDSGSRNVNSTKGFIAVERRR